MPKFLSMQNVDGDGMLISASIDGAEGGEIGMYRMGDEAIGVAMTGGCVTLDEAAVQRAIDMLSRFKVQIVAAKDREQHARLAAKRNIG